MKSLILTHPGILITSCGTPETPEPPLKPRRNSIDFILNNPNRSAKGGHPGTNISPLPSSSPWTDLPR